MSAYDGILGSCRLPGRPLYLIGNFDLGVTVLNQQVRALNLAFALIEGGRIPVRNSPEDADGEMRVAVLGAGFAGLTFVAGLLAKRSKARITIFEQRDALLPFQQGSDTRWLHPHIYDWPRQGSETNAASLPVMNWTAARASDVVVQVLAEWVKVYDGSLRGAAEALTGKGGDERMRLFCGTRHLQVHDVAGDPSVLGVEWVGERRDPRDGRLQDRREGSAEGGTETFDLVVVATGFGRERDKALSYWRNDGLGQPNLDQPRRTYLVSGQGDGAMIDLFRLRISHYRQDRILSELFDGNPILDDVTAAYESFGSGDKPGIFASFDAIAANKPDEFKKVQGELTKRLRRDTDVILHLKVGKVSELLDGTSIRMSFQNKLLAYLLYRCGAFVPSAASESSLIALYGIPKEQVVRRHGTARDELLRTLLAPKLWQELASARGDGGPGPLSQRAEQEWPGGYFGYGGTIASLASRPKSDKEAKSWRREHLPDPTQLLASTLCASIAGYLRTMHDLDKRLRVTLHRTMVLGKEPLLQQCCNYFGLGISPDFDSAARRVFPVDKGTIGLACLTRRAIRSRAGVDHVKLEAAMGALDLNEASSKMSRAVRSLLAVPLVSRHEGSSHTAGVLYLDSEQPDFFDDAAMLAAVASMLQSFMKGIQETSRKVDRIRNPAPSFRPGSPSADEQLGRLIEKPAVKDALEVLMSPVAPAVDVPFQLEFEYSDFVPVRLRADA